MENNPGFCHICEKPLEECMCCAECGHICDLDYGELYCPVCFPEKKQVMNKHDYFMHLAIEEAEIAFSEGEVPVGAVLVKDNEVIAVSHNKKETSNDPTAHAELNVIRDGAVTAGEWRLEDITLYVTKEPCVMCAGAMVNARLGRLVYGCKDERFGAVSSRYQLVNDPSLNHEVKVVCGIMEYECADLLKKFFMMRRHNKS